MLLFLILPILNQLIASITSKVSTAQVVWSILTATRAMRDEPLGDDIAYKLREYASLLLKSTVR